MKLFLQLLAVMVAGVVGGQAVMLVEGDPWLTLGLGLLTAVLTLAL
ncbi:hypothetical protein [Nocardiopsis sp. NPDC006832]